MVGQFHGEGKVVRLEGEVDVLSEAGVGEGEVFAGEGALFDFVEERGKGWVAVL